MIARHGAAPISESAFRARIRSRRIGVVRVGGRVYTNPLNLVAAGLLPVDVLSGSGGPSAEIDDAELHAWLNPDGARAETNEERDGNRTRDETGDPDNRDEAEPFDDAGPVERALAGGARPAEPSARDETITERHIDQRLRRPWRSSSAKTPRRSHLIRLGSVFAVGVAVVVIITSTRGDTGSEVSPLRPVALATAADYKPPVKLIDRAIARRDFDKALDLAALSGDAALLARTQRDAADALLARAERSRKRGTLASARKDVRTVRNRFGDPRPAAAEAISARIARDERSARQRARDAASARSASVTSTGATSTATATHAAPADASSAAPQSQSGSQASSSQGESAASGTSKSTRQRDADKPVDPGLF